jgi:hypothetical protein
VLLKRRFGWQTSSRWLSSQKFDWIVQVVLQHAIKAILVLSTRKIMAGRQQLGCWDGTFYYGARSLRLTAVCCAAASSDDPFYMIWPLPVGRGTWDDAISGAARGHVGVETWD